MGHPYHLVATGGTFDQVHAGHIALLSKAFELGEHVIIGISSDKFARKRGKKIVNKFNVRRTNLKQAIKEKFGNVQFQLAKLEGDFGPAVTTGAVDAVIASTETESKTDKLNALRGKMGLSPVKVIAIELVIADDGQPISSTRIRSGEIDNQGRVLSKRRRAA